MARTTPARSRPVVLLVEDERDVRAVVAEYLSDCGFEVVEAGSAGEALLVLDSGAPVDVVFSDVQMPGPMDGVQLARWLGSTRPLLPVILASGRTARAEAEQHCAPGAFFEKPYRLELVASRIEELLRAH